MRTAALDRQELTDRILANTHCSLWELLRRTARRVPDATAVCAGGEQLTYSELSLRALRSAAALSRAGVGRGTRVGYLLGPSTDWVVLHYALMRLGAIAVPLNPSAPARDVRAILTETRCEVLVAGQVGIVDVREKLTEVGALADDQDEGVLGISTLRTMWQLDPLESEVASTSRQFVFGTTDGDALPVWSETAPSDLAYVIYTSGSTAAPKGAQLTHAGITGTGTGGGLTLGLEADDGFLGVLPPFHSAAYTWLTACHVLGATAHLVESSDPKAMLDEIEYHRVTAIIAVHTQLLRMLEHPTFAGRDLSALEVVGTGATDEFFARLSDELGVHRLVTQFASTESSGLTSLTEPAAYTHHHGRPLPGIELRVVDPEQELPCPVGVPGELRFRGWAQFAGYVSVPLPELIDVDGFFRSGDYGQLNADGTVTYLGRYKMMIKTGGENVSEFEVESFLENEFTEVELAQVVGVPDPEWGEAVVAYVQLRADQPHTVVDELGARCRGQIAGFKVPKRFVPVPAGQWPLLANGKIDKQALRAQAATEAPAIS